MDYNREEIIAKVAESISESFKKHYINGTEPDEDVEEFAKVKSQINEHSITMEEIFTYLRRKGKLLESDQDDGDNVMTAINNVLVYKLEMQTEGATKLMKDIMAGKGTSEDERKAIIHAWMEGSVIMNVIKCYLKFSKNAGKLPDASIFNISLVNQDGPDGGELKCGMSNCYYPDKDGMDDYEKYSQQIVDNSVVAVEIRNLPALKMISVAFMRDSKIQKVSYHTFKDEYKIRKTPEIVFDDQHSHDEWIRSKRKELQSMKEEKLKDAVKEIFKDGVVEIHKVGSPEELKEILEEAARKMKKEKPGGRFNFSDN